MNSKLILVSAILVASLSLCACNQVAEDTVTIEDTKWVLESYGEQGNLQAVLENTEITAAFESTEGKVKGSAGCNSYFGSYEINNRNLSISQIGNTEMYCMEPEGIIDQETEYLRLLSALGNYEIIEGKLRITTGSEVLIFKTK